MPHARMEFGDAVGVSRLVDPFCFFLFIVFSLWSCGWVFGGVFVRA